MRGRPLLLLALAALCLGPVCAEATVTYDSVDFDTIEDALAAAETSADTAPTLTLTSDTTETALTTVDGTTIATLTIEGAYKLTNATTRHFQVTGGTLTFSDAVILDGGSAGGGIEITGGAVNFGSTVTFQNNTAAADDGGALRVTGGTVTFTGAPTFTGNTATAGNGGAVCVTGGTVTFTDSPTFTSNTATAGNGGALWVSAVSQIPTTVAMTFTGNRATAGSGGAIYSNGTEAMTLDNNFTFNGNSAGTNGGAVYAAGNVTVSGGTFGTTTANSAGTNGGAICAAGTATLSGGTFDRNTATGDGGAVYATGNVTVTGGSFGSTAANSATGDGGAIRTAGTATLSGGTFANNRAANGGAVYATGNVTVTDAPDFTTVNTATTGDGGAIYSGGNVSVTEVSFSSQTATTGDGGAICAAGDVTLTDAEFASNTAGANGGAIRAGGNVTISGGVFGESSGTKNTAAGDGGAVYAAGTVVVSSGTEDPVFSYNTASGSGGAVYAAELAADTRVENATFTSNSAGGNGGAIFVDSTTASAVTLSETITDSTFTSNSASGSGGAIYAANTVSNTVNFSVSDTSFISNTSGTADRGGGAIYSDNSLGLRNDYFGQNRSAGTVGGGAIYAMNRLTVDQSFFEGNTVSAGAGGAVYMSHGTETLTIRTSYFKENAGVTQGGALNIQNVGTATVTQTTFQGNSLYSPNLARGGAIYINSTSSATKVENCTFAGNVAEGASSSFGGALASANHANLINCTFSLSNRASGASANGGALYLASSNVTLGGCLVAGNTATYGGDIFTASGVTPVSKGYNRIGVVGFMSSSGAGQSDWMSIATGSTTNDLENSRWTTTTFFGASASLATNTGLQAGLSSALVYIPTIALNESAPATTRALDVIPANDGYFPAVDARGTERPQPEDGEKDVGAVETLQSGSDSDTEDPTAYAIASVRIGGIPNTLTTIGQTAALTATVTYLNGTTSTTEGVTWSSSRPSVATITNQGIIYSRNLGTTVISVATTRNASTGSPATDSVSLTVSNAMKYLNVSPYVWNLLDNVNQEQDDFVMALADADPALVNASAFSSPFSKAWGATPRQVTEIASTSNFQLTSKATGYTHGGYKAMKKSAALTLSGQQGAVLPVKYTWALTRDELSDLMAMGGTISTSASTPSASRLFSSLKVGMETSGGFVPVIGEGGVSAAEAESSGALVVSQTNNGVAIEVTPYLANVAGGKAQLINKLLTVPDGTSDSTISGTLWLMASQGTDGGGNTGGNENNSGSGGGGGCSLSSPGLWTLALLAMALLLSPLSAEGLRRKNIF